MPGIFDLFQAPTFQGPQQPIDFSQFDPQFIDKLLQQQGGPGSGVLAPGQAERQVGAGGGGIEALLAGGALGGILGSGGDGGGGGPVQAPRSGSAGTPTGRTPREAPEIDISGVPLQAAAGDAFQDDFLAQIIRSFSR